MEDKKIYSFSLGTIVLVLIFIIVIILLLNIIKTTKTNDISNNIIEENQIENNIQTNTSKNEENITNSIKSTILSTEYKTSTNQNYLNLGEWGKASKFEKSNTYKDIGVQVYEIVSGDDAKIILENWSSENKTSYSVLPEGMEWKIIKYRLDLTNIQMTNYGNSQNIDINIQGIGNSTAVKYNNKIYNVTPINLTSNKYVTTNIGEGQVAVQLPIGYTDYVVAVGNYMNTVAYFKGI